MIKTNLSLEQYNAFRSRSKSLYKASTQLYFDIHNYIYYSDIGSENDYQDFLHIQKSNKQKRRRLNKRFKNMFKYNEFVYFITLTFDDNSINLSDKYICSILNKELDKYDDFVYNFDYSPDFNRKHIHGLIATNEDLYFKLILDNKGRHFSYEGLNWSFGFNYVLPVLKCTKKITNYICKLSNHAIKSNEACHYKRGINYTDVVIYKHRLVKKAIQIGYSFFGRDFIVYSDGLVIQFNDNEVFDNFVHYFGYLNFRDIYFKDLIYYCDVINDHFYINDSYFL